MPKVALTSQILSQIAARRRLAEGLMATVEINALSTEYEIRNSLSRLYYSFFHMGLALLLSSGWDVQKASKDHGRFQSAMDAGAGKFVGTFVRRVYRFRLLCDYDEAMFQWQYGDIEKARQLFIAEIKMARTNFHWLRITVIQNLK